MKPTDDVSFGLNSRGPRGAERAASQSVRVDQGADPTRTQQEPQSDRSVLAGRPRSKRAVIEINVTG